MIGFLRPRFTKMGSGSNETLDVHGTGEPAPEDTLKAEQVVECERIGEDRSGEGSDDAKALLDMLDDLVFIVDRKGFILEVNGAVEAALGLSREKLRSTQVMQLPPIPGSL